jgi:ribonuclease BN (tRNA processing enzyme)
MAPTTFIDGIKIRLFGPKEGKWDPHVMMHSVMERGLFPVDFTEQKHHFPKPKSFEHPKLHVMIIHPKGGMKHMLVSDYKSLRAKGEPFPFGQKNERYPLKECMVITMHKSNHPESTICYRMDELPTGKSFALLTDHENQAGIPISLQRHLRDLDLLIEDVQYSLHDYYQGGKAGFGHAAPDYAVKLANLIGAKRLGFTHHDPFKDDDYVEAVLAEGKQCAADALAAAGKGASGLILPDSIFACADFAARPEVIKV